MKRTAATNSNSLMLLINTKSKRIKTRNSVKCVYLPDECWELVFKQLPMYDEDYNSLSLVSKQFLSITNRLRSSLTIKSSKDDQTTTKQVLNLIRRFPKLTSLHFCGPTSLDLDYILPRLSTFPFRLKSLKLDHISAIPASGLVAFSRTNPPLNSLTCSYTDHLHSTHMFLIGDCFPELQRLDLSHCNHIYSDSIYLLLMGCCDNITHLNLASCAIFTEDRIMNFQVPNLKVLNLSRSWVDDHTLNVITKSCPGILKLSLKYGYLVGDKGVKRVLRNCKQLREINLKRCRRVVLHVDVASLLLLRPSLTKITLPNGVTWVA